MTSPRRPHNSMSGRKDVSAVTPPDSNQLKLSARKSIAAGIPAATSSMFHGIKKMGFTKTIKTLTTVNQPTGFDCPGCAWPDPKHATTFEFCENGAKAVADEAMKGNVKIFSQSTQFNNYPKKATTGLTDKAELQIP